MTNSHERNLAALVARGTAFHRHLDQCAQCRGNPWGVCAEGVRILTGEGAGLVEPAELAYTAKLVLSPLPPPPAQPAPSPPPAPPTQSSLDRAALARILLWLALAAGLGGLALVAGV